AALLPTRTTTHAWAVLCQRRALPNRLGLCLRLPLAVTYDRHYRGCVGSSERLRRRRATSRLVRRHEHDRGEAVMIKKPAAVCEVHLDQMEQGISNLHGYERALVVFRLRGSVVGREWIPVVKGRITAAGLREHTTQVAWPSWLVVNQDAGDGSPLPTASVVVCTRDRTEDLANCLPDLQLLAAQGHDVIVVDSCPSDGSSERLVASYPAIRYLHEPRPGLD